MQRPPALLRSSTNHLSPFTSHVSPFTRLYLCTFASLREILSFVPGLAGIAGCLIFGGPTSYSLVNPGVEVRYKIGNERLVKVTQKAAAKLAQLLERQGRPTGALRVAVIGGGCSGLQYKMDLVDGPMNRDILVESNQVRVVVDPKSALFVSGSLVDFSDDLQKGGFKVTNPNAVAHCSCGESFSA